MKNKYKREEKTKVFFNYDGHNNSGYCNNGYRNSGNHNIGTDNDGSYNIGHDNCGNHNIGDGNTGNKNIGDWNTGSHNAGFLNTGDWNKTNNSNGYFNTKERNIIMFNCETDWLYTDWLMSEARNLLQDMPALNTTEWINLESNVVNNFITNELLVTKGKLIEKDFKYQNLQAQIWWKKLSDKQKYAIFSLPNFDATIFSKITGIVVSETDENRLKYNENIEKINNQSEQSELELEYIKNVQRKKRKKKNHTRLDFYNSGFYNDGKRNSGGYNLGNNNSGFKNEGDGNSGSYNIGNSNSGVHNKGRCNSGSFNVCNYNSGNRNTGSCNSGDLNDTNYSCGCFNTKEEPIFMFNKPSNWTHRTWLKSEAKKIMDKIAEPVTELIPVDGNNVSLSKNKLAVENKKCLCSQEKWNLLKDNEKQIIMNLPNFDKQIFKEITSVVVA